MRPCLLQVHNKLDTMSVFDRTEEQPAHIHCSTDDPCGLRVELDIEDLQLSALLDSFYPDGHSILATLPFPTKEIMNTLATTQVCPSGRKGDAVLQPVSYLCNSSKD